MKIPDHIQKAIAAAKKDGHKGVRGFVSGIDEHNEYMQLLSEGKLESFLQRYEVAGGYFTECMLMRKPNKVWSMA